MLKVDNKKSPPKGSDSDKSEEDIASDWVQLLKSLQFVPRGPNPEAADEPATAAAAEEPETKESETQVSSSCSPYWTPARLSARV